MEVREIAQALLSHKDKKGSTAKWFVFSFIPLLNLWVMWKAAEEIAGHEKIVKEYESIDHKKPRGSTGAWFALFFVPAILGVLASFSIFFGGLGFGLVMAIALGIVALVIGLYVLWRMAEVVSGHDKTYEKYELLVHKERKDSTVKWFIIGIIPIVNLYLLWKVGEAISGHETVYE